MTTFDDPYVEPARVDPDGGLEDGTDQQAANGK